MNKRNKIASLLSLAVGFLLMGVVAQAQVPQLINYQGVLKDSGGNPITGSENIVFSIYDAPTGGTLLWQESHGGVSVTNGLFNVLLGSTTFPANFFSRSDLYLGVKVGTDAEMTPRQQLASVSDALKAADADTLGDGLVDFDQTGTTTQVHTVGFLVSNTLGSRIKFDLQGTDTPDFGRLVLRSFNGKTEYLMTGYKASTGQFTEMFKSNLDDRTLSLDNNAIIIDANQNVNVQGDVRATSFVVNSSRTLKKDITPLNSQDYASVLNKIGKLQMVRYLYKTEDNRPPHLGVIAEDSPQDILDPSGKRLSVADYAGFVLAGLKAQMDEMKVQMQEMQAQRQEIKELMGKVKKLEDELAAKQAPDVNNIAAAY